MHADINRADFGSGVSISRDILKPDCSNCICLGINI